MLIAHQTSIKSLQFFPLGGLLSPNAPVCRVRYEKLYAFNFDFKVLFFQPTEDVVLMGKTLEKVFLDKLNGMPVPEVDVPRPLKGKAKKGKTPARSGVARATRKTVDSQSVHTVTSSNDAIENPPLSQDQPIDPAQPTSNGQSVLPANAISTTPVVQINNSHVQINKVIIYFAYVIESTMLGLLIRCLTCV